MKINIYGFEWELGDGISFDEFCNYLKTLSGKEIYNKMIAVDKKDGFWIGVLLTIKDMKSFCKITKDGGSFVITPQELEEGDGIADFNFFIINPATARGLYQHYHQSAATNTFCYFCRKQYEDLKRLRISEEIQKAGGNFAPNSVKKRIEKGFKGSLRYITIVKKESFNECLKTLKRIKSFSFEYMTLVAEEKKFAPVFAVASKVSNKAIFRKSETKMQAITGAISDMISSSRLKRASVKGMDPESNEVIYKLFNDYDSFEKLEYNDVIGNVRLDSKNLSESLVNSDLVQRMLNLVKSNPKISAILSVKAT